MKLSPLGVGFTLEDAIVRFLQRDRGLEIKRPTLGGMMLGTTRKCRKCNGSGRYNVREERSEGGKIVITVVGKQCEPCDGTGQVSA